MRIPEHWSLCDSCDNTPSCCDEFAFFDLDTCTKEICLLGKKFSVDVDLMLFSMVVRVACGSSYDRDPKECIFPGQQERFLHVNLGDRRERARGLALRRQ